MWRDLTVNVTDLLFSVSEAMDLADPSLTDHQMRTAFVALQMARHAGMDAIEQDKLFVAAMLHDIGALSPEEKLGIHSFEDLLPEPHCMRGEKLFEEAFWLAPSAPVVRWHHTAMRAHRAAARTLQTPHVLASQILFLADHLERAIDRKRFVLHQHQELIRRMQALSPDSVHPDVIGLFDAISGNEDFWLDLVSGRLGDMLKQRSPLRTVDLDFATARALAGVFKDMTDFRSRFTATHSSGVAACGVGLASALSFTGKGGQQIELAGMLHDIGKLVVPNAILCKSGRLNPHEYAVIRQHPHHTHRILARINGLQQVAEWAGLHHERLDGSGYCGGMNRGELDLGAKVVAVADVATAMAEQRPYRDPCAKTLVLGTLGEMAGAGLLDGQVVAALADNYSDIMGAAAEAQSADQRRFNSRYAAVA